MTDAEADPGADNHFYPSLLIFDGPGTNFESAGVQAYLGTLSSHFTMWNPTTSSPIILYQQANKNNAPYGHNQFANAPITISITYNAPLSYVRIQRPASLGLGFINLVEVELYSNDVKIPTSGQFYIH
jgi:hypothetical protein